MSHRSTFLAYLHFRSCLVLAVSSRTRGTGAAIPECWVKENFLGLVRILGIVGSHTRLFSAQTVIQHGHAMSY